MWYFKNRAKSSFYLVLNTDDFKRGDILNTSVEKIKLEVLETPHIKWYKKLLEIITFGWYRAPWQYKVKLV